jgi:hypothetical protein
MRAQTITRRTCVLGGLTVAALVAAGGASVWAQDADVIQNQDTNISGIAIEIIQCKRKNGVLTIKMRLRNTGDEKKSVYITDGGAAYDKYYLTAGDKKYFILRDSEKVPLATQDNGGYVNPDIEKNATFTWWAKYPAPPVDVKTITFYTGLSAPFEDLPITD